MPRKTSTSRPQNTFRAAAALGWAACPRQRTSEPLHDAGGSFSSGYAEYMKRVVILGPGGSGKSTLAVRLGEITGLRVIELDKVFWRPGLVATPRDQWVEVQ